MIYIIQTDNTLYLLVIVRQGTRVWSPFRVKTAKQFCIDQLPHQLVILAQLTSLMVP